MILVTGGAGFIGSNFIHLWCRERHEPVLNLDALTYAGNPDNLEALPAGNRHRFVRGDIRDAGMLQALLAEHRPRAVVHFAAHTHVDRAIAGPDSFIDTNVLGTQRLLESCRQYWLGTDAASRRGFRFLHVSTDEVYGSLSAHAQPWTEASPLAPHNPYAASKAAADHLVQAYHHTYGLPTLITRCGNNYGPRQFPEKLIPLVIVRRLAGTPIPVYGDGGQQRDWIHVEDHCQALLRVLDQGRPGESYHVAGHAETDNLGLIRQLSALLDARRPDAPVMRIRHVADRPAHDRRYALDTGKIERELGWRPRIGLDAGLAATIDWYLGNPDWLSRVTSGAYREWVASHYGDLSA
ncbi:MAG: dTDP-glucose 4,6-dehydratase [Pigmentiphaga sp.]|nr:dTDP-glucose 4,6-dehydratase [Pigmentiphaga sp.]